MIIRQGDVLLIKVDSIPKDMNEVELDNGRIVLMYGEVTGHAHAITVSPEEIVGEVIRKAKLFALENGQRFLEVKAPVSLTHEEHTSHLIPPGFYKIPVQVDMTADKLPRKVTD